jgi:translation initiation factor 2-alpha kinase 4
MTSGFFGALQDDASSDEDNDHRHYQPAPPTTSESNIHIPAYEDLSTARDDEETVLSAVYGPDFKSQTGVWGCPKLQVQVRPPDIQEPYIGAQCLLSVQLGKQYPYIVPTIEIHNVKGLSKEQQQELMDQLQTRAKELAFAGSVMMLDLVQVTEDYLLEHNRDPNLSAWEQMKAREALERQSKSKSQEQQAKEEMYRLMNMNNAASEEPLSPLASNTRTTFDEYSNDTRQNNVASTDIQRELLRQREALEAANRQRLRKGDTPLQRNDSSTQDDHQNNNSESEDDDDFDFDMEYDASTLANSGSSRYRIDFIELGILGRGGGGEVVKVRNRLDRRIYAIKKIILESERGRKAKYAALQNRKLRREVTTISRMMHNHVVRYFQAWVRVYHIITCLFVVRTIIMT